MKKIKFSSYLLQFTVLIFILLLFTECRKDAEFDKGVNTFFATFFFIIFMVIGGIPSIITSAISLKSEKSAIKVVAIVFVSIFGLFCLISVPMYSEFWTKGSKDWIGLIAIIQLSSLIMSIIFIAVGSSNRAKAKLEKPIPTPVAKPVAPKKSDDEIDYMDEMLND